ncbi:hypothetical protein NDU88_002960 [Pleurodeles waltl]|uniref:Uncharacterized protein n=1 Tax=Pleurodeles waltl TaxID=8319 RepID=A0AAV7MP77_PLEWA|nr:hypothetical protein NDU88_002960 [Pleurodeles waltl]
MNPRSQLLDVSASPGQSSTGAARRADAPVSPMPHSGAAAEPVSRWHAPPQERRELLRLLLVAWMVTKRGRGENPSRVTTRGPQHRFSRPRAPAHRRSVSALQRPAIGAAERDLRRPRHRGPPPPAGRHPATVQTQLPRHRS